ncbi:hypothetical protein NE865_02947 [Phthorimaea operculella]|nr:hypothetical protein NE865_02947 [Phthorimaea operculella]
MANRDLEDLLASDDELPNFYEEDADIPAYQNDTRFDIIDFPWINKKVLENCPPQNISSHSSSSDINKDLSKPSVPKPQKSKNDKEKSREKKIITKGILNKCDIFCVKCIANFSTDTTLLWFITFLMQKDMLSDYIFLKSCLVQDYIYETAIKKQQDAIDCETHNFEIIVK